MTTTPASTRLDDETRVCEPVTLPCLSVRQPWAWLILHGGKDVENRRWTLPRHARGTVLLHAAKGMTREEYEDATDYALDVGQQHGRAILTPPADDLDRGGIVGAARIVGQFLPHESNSSPWHIRGQYGFRLEKVTPLPFRAYKGALGFFRVRLTAEEDSALRAAGLVLP